MTSTVTTEIDDHVCTIEFGNPDRRNALSPDLLTEFRGALDDAEAADDVRVLVVRSDPTGKAFCSGCDLSEFEEGCPPDETERSFAETMERLRVFDYPIICMLDGDVWGGGVELAATCDLRVAASDVQLGITPAKLGIIYPARDVLAGFYCRMPSRRRTARSDGRY